MQFVGVSVFAVLSTVLASSLLPKNVQADSIYTTKYDNVDVDGILASPRLLKNYINCLLDKGKCTADGRELKKYLPDAIATECKKCSPAQKQIAGKILSELLLHHRREFDKLAQKYDPEKKFVSKYLNDDSDYEDYENA